MPPRRPIGCQNYHDSMARSYRERRVFDHPQAEVRRAAERAVVEVGLTIAPGGTDWQLAAQRGVNAGSWGERIRFTMATNPGGGTQVIIESKLVLGLFDWGKNRENISALFSSMEVVLGPGHRLEIEP